MLAGSPLRSPLVGPLGGVLGTGLPWESGGGGVAVAPPVNTVAPTTTGTRGVGLTLGGTDGTWTGTPTPTLTYQWQRGSTQFGGGSWSNIVGATAATYVETEADATLDLRRNVIGTNAVGAVTANGTTLAPINYTTYFPDHDIGLFPVGGLTLADSGTTIDISVGTLGGKAGLYSMQAIGAANRPAYLATGGSGSRPCGDWDGVNDVLRDASATWSLTPAKVDIRVAVKLDGAETANDTMLRVTLGDLIRLGVDATPRCRCTTAGTGGATSTGTTDLSAAWVMAGAKVYSGGGTGSQQATVSGVAEDTDAITHAAWTDGGDASLGASTTGATPTAGLYAGWAIGMSAGTDAAHLLSAQQILDMKALFKACTGTA